MNTSFLLCIIFTHYLFACINICEADNANLQDTCPAVVPSGPQSIFINGYPCKNPANIIASDFKTSKLNHAGNTDNFLGSSTSILTALEFPGLNTLGLSVARTDLAVDGIVSAHAHPRASEMFFVSKGAVVAGFVDTKNQLFQKVLKEGDVIMFPRGFFHFCLNVGFELATAFSVLSSQNPGVVSITGTMFDPEFELTNKFVEKLRRLSDIKAGNTTMNGF